MEEIRSFQEIRCEYQHRIVKIQSPNNDAYEREVKLLEERIEQIHIRQVRAYKEAEEILVF